MNQEGRGRFEAGNRDSVACGSIGDKPGEVALQQPFAAVTPDAPGWVPAPVDAAAVEAPGVPVAESATVRRIIGS